MSAAGVVAPPVPAPNQQDERTKALLAKLWNDPRSREQARVIAKELYPELSLPEDQLEPAIAPLKAEIEALKAAAAKRAEDDTKAADDKRAADLESAITTARTRFHLTEAGFKQMTDRMLETKNFSDPEGAAAWVAAQNPPPKPVSGAVYGPQSLDFAGSQTHDATWAKLHENPQKYLEDELKTFASDPDRYTAETLGLAA